MLRADASNVYVHVGDAVAYQTKTETCSTVVFSGGPLLRSTSEAVHHLQKDLR